MSTEHNTALVRWDGQRMEIDAALLGWSKAEFARKARVSDMTVIRFLRGERQTPATAKKLSKALRRSIRRYLVASRMAVAS